MEKGVLWLSLALLVAMVGLGGDEGARADDLNDGTVEQIEWDKTATSTGPLVDHAEVDAGVLSSADVKAYKALWRDALAGKKPDAAKVDDKVLMGHVEAAYLLAPGHRAGFDELNGWLKRYRDLGEADDVYRLADARRQKPEQKCTSKKVPHKVKRHGKTKTVMRTVKSCKSVGSWGPAPVRTLAMELKEKRAADRLAAQNARLAKMSERARQVLGASWRARVRGRFDEALRVLLAPGARDAAGEVPWQGELVKVADYYHGKRDWKEVLRAAAPALDVRGPDRDEALWLAGFAQYRLGQVREAADTWATLVKEEPEGGAHHARAAWWAARAYAQLGQQSKVKALLQAGSADVVGFYGQLCAMKLGQPADLQWGVPKVSDGDVARLKKIPVVHHALALAQLGEVDLAQRHLRNGDDDVPYQLTRALATVAVQARMPATALRAGRDLYERGEVVASALFPDISWQPRGDWRFDRALITGIMRQESAFQPSIGSWAGAQGLMQIMPATGAFVARQAGLPRPDREDLHDPILNLTLAQNYLLYLSGQLDGNLMMVVASYNGGMGNVRRWLDRGVTPGDDPILWLESIPFDETRDYVEKVFANYWVYQQRAGKQMWSLRALAHGDWPLRQNAMAAHQAEGG
ncbi:MAG: transglycosylase SLT domain-containing protein [Proteobacteria bacterium]|nr:transglycosylase SLT domain-containing protein [Pseudomonadota bacterium]